MGGDSWLIGVGLGVSASILINFGNNLQSCVTSAAPRHAPRRAALLLPQLSTHMRMMLKQLSLSDWPSNAAADGD